MRYIYDVAWSDVWIIASVGKQKMIVFRLLESKIQRSRGCWTMICSAWEVYSEEKMLIYDVMIYTSLLNRSTQSI